MKFLFVLRLISGLARITISARPDIKGGVRSFVKPFCKDKVDFCIIHNQLHLSNIQTICLSNPEAAQHFMHGFVLH